MWFLREKCASGSVRRRGPGAILFLRPCQQPWAESLEASWFLWTPLRTHPGWVFGNALPPPFLVPVAHPYVKACRDLSNSWLKCVSYGGQLHPCQMLPHLHSNYIKCSSFL